MFWAILLNAEAGLPSMLIEQSSISLGYSKFMTLNELEDPYLGYVWNDKCVVEVEFFSVKLEGMEPTSRPIYPSISKQSNVIHSEDDDVVNYKDLGQIDRALVPMIEDVCSRHPSLFDCNKKRSCKFSEWAFTCLGQVLHFLKKNKWKDMNEEACEQLQALWEELEMSRMELSWLEPRVKAALNMKGYVEKEMRVKRLKQDLVVLEAEVEKMKANLANTDFIRANGGFEEMDLDLDNIIGYGNP